MDTLMHYLRTLQNKSNAWFKLYVATFEQVIHDTQFLYRRLNTFMDDLLESEQTQNFIIALIIVAPFIGVWFFFSVLI